MSAPKYRLDYFPNLGGRAQRVRLTFVAAGVEYVDGTDANFGELKQKAHALPFGHFPILTVDGDKVFSDSIALQLLVAAREAPHLIPKDPLDQARVLSVANTSEMRFTTFVKWYFAKEGKEQIHEQGVAEARKFLQDLEYQLGDKEYLGTTFSYGDLTAFDWFLQTHQVWGLDESSLPPKLAAWYKRVAGQKGVAEFLASLKK